MLPGIAELTLLGRLFYFVELDKESNFDIVIFDGFASGHFDSLMRTPDAVMQSGMTGPVIDETTRVRRFLNDKSKVGVVLVTVPEELIVSEALDFSQKLAKNSPAEITAVIANRCWPQLSDDMPNIPDSLKFSVDYWSAQEKAQKKNLERLQSGLKTINPTTPIYVLEERGSFPEPLDPKAMTLWIEGAKKL